MNVKKRSLSNLILLSLEKAVDGYVRLEDFLYNTHIYARGYDRPLKKSVLAQALRRLREKGLVEESWSSSGLVYKLSEIGQDLIYLEQDPNKDWDGKWRIIIFDIPESHRKIRRILRSKLREWGFISWQKSVWATKRNITERLKRLIIELDINDWIAVIESENVFIKQKH